MCKIVKICKLQGMLNLYKSLQIFTFVYNCKKIIFFTSCKFTKVHIYFIISHNTTIGENVNKFPNDIRFGSYREESQESSFEATLHLFWMVHAL